MAPPQTVRFDLTDPQVLADPHVVFDQMRREDPVHWSESLSAWIVTATNSCCSALREPALSNERAHPSSVRNSANATQRWPPTSSGWSAR